jgi:hypothetical protein
MVLHHLIHLGERPVLRIGRAQEDGDVVRVRVPGGQRSLQRTLIAGLERDEDVRSPEDVLT